MVASARLDSNLIESPFVIHPGEARQIAVRIDDRRQFEGAVVFNGFITSDPGFTVVDAHAGAVKVDIREVPPDVDPHSEEWVRLNQLLPPGEDIILLVKNNGDRPAPYRARLR